MEGGRFVAVAESVDGQEADGLHVSTAFERGGLPVVDFIVADVAVATEELDGSVPLNGADGFE